MNYDIEILKWLFLLAVLLILFILWSLLNRSWQQTKYQNTGHTSGRGRGSGRSDQEIMGAEPESLDSREEDYRRYLEDLHRQQEQERQRAVEAQAKRVRQLAENNPELLKDILDVSGQGHVSIRDILSDPDKLRRISQSLPKDLITIAEFASEGIQLEDVEFKGMGEFIEELYAQDRIDQEVISDFDDLEHIPDEEWALPLGEVVSNLEDGSYYKDIHYRWQNLIRLLYVLEDGSGSMNDHMRRTGERRYLYSRGKVVDLANQAVKGKTYFVYRQFDGKPHPPIEVLDKKAANRFLARAYIDKPSGGGTNILRAIRQAVSDIEKKKDINKADILLITDGRDDQITRASQVEKALKGVNLHVISIGRSSPILKKVAKTYQEYR